MALITRNIKVLIGSKLCEVSSIESMPLKGQNIYHFKTILDEIILISNPQRFVRFRLYDVSLFVS